MRDAPHLLVEWEPGWRSFATSVRAALRPQPRRSGFRGVPYGTRPRGPLSSLLLHFALVFTYVSLSPWFHLLAPVQPQIVLESHAYNGPIYYLSEGLPPVADVGGAESGRTGRAGGAEAFHSRQVIRIARGNRVSRVIVDAPKLNLPRTDGAVANLLALSSPMPAPPAHALQNFQRIGAVLPQVAAVPPAPDIARLVGPRMPDVRPDVIPPPARPNEMPRDAKLMLPAVEAVPPIPAEATRSALATGSRVDVGLPAIPQPAPNPDLIRSATGANNLRGLVGGSTVGVGPSAALIITVEPGDTLGNPAGGPGPGSLAKSPAGTGAGLGGSGGGGGLGKGTGPGSADKGTGSGSGNVGTGLGADPNARGISSATGPGGAGTGAPAAPIMAGVSISSGGGVHLPSFGGTSTGPAVPPRSGKERRRPPGVIVIASPRSVTTLGNLGNLHGGRVYTIYLDTRAGTAVMQFSDPSAREKFEQDLTAPEPLLVDVPAEMKITQTLAACVLDRSGALRNIRILRTATPEVVSRLVSVLAKWRFRPVFRGSDPIDVETLLGFGIDTR
jgi:hypothetical protein